METYQASVESEIHQLDQTKILRLVLRPLQAEVRAPMYTRPDTDPLLQQVELARQLARNVHRTIALEFYHHLVGKQAPTGQDWDQFDFDELRKTRARLTFERQRSEVLTNRLNALADAVRAAGWNPDTIISRYEFPHWDRSDDESL